MWAFLFISLIWISTFIVDKMVFITMYSCASYYFSSEGGEDGSANVIEGVKFAYTKHFGSIALGSCIQTIIKIVQILADSAENGSDEGIVVIVAACIRCCLRCIEDMMNYLNVLAYANMAISGDKYCTSAWNGFLLNLRHVGKFYLAQTIGSFLVFIGILMISLLSTGIFYLMVMNSK